MRKQFEKWYRENRCNFPEGLWDSNNKRYLHLYIELSWKSWQASQLRKPKCSTCMHAVPSTYYTVEDRDGNKLSICVNDHFVEHQGGKEENNNLIYAFNENGDFFVGSNFGCIYHEEAK